MQLFAMNRVFGLYASNDAIDGTTLAQKHKNAPRLVNMTPAMDA